MIDLTYEEKLVQNGIGIKTGTYLKVMLFYYFGIALGYVHTAYFGRN